MRIYGLKQKRGLHWFKCPNHHGKEPWGPIIPGVCWLLDFITGGYAHD